VSAVDSMGFSVAAIIPTDSRLYRVELELSHEKTMQEDCRLLPVLLR
jgi:hypothetical protein